MRRKFTVYGLRFSKTTFWDRLNTGFLDPAVATVLTACGIETTIHFSNIKTTYCRCCNSAYRLRYWNVIHLGYFVSKHLLRCNSAYRLRYWNPLEITSIKITCVVSCNSAYRLRYWNLPRYSLSNRLHHYQLQQYLPLAVLKLSLVLLQHHIGGF